MYQEQRTHLLKTYASKTRYNGRGMLDYRDIVVEYDVAKGAEGSAKVKIGGTEVIAGVKMAIEKPYPDTPDKGNLMVNAELLPLSNPEFEAGPPGMQSIELARVVDRGIRESKAINPTKLCIKAGEKVWSVMIDICTINDEGNLLDAAGLAALAALKHAVFPKLNEDGSIDYEEKTKEKLPMDRQPILITVVKIGEHLIVDPLIDEEKVIDARLTVGVTEKDTIVAMQKGGDKTLSAEDIDKMVEIAVEKAKELRSKL